MNLKCWLENHKRLFWVLNTCGWAGFGITSYLSGRYWGEEWGYPCYRFAGAAFGFLISVGLRHFYRRIWGAPVWWRIILVASASYVCAAMLAVLTNYVLWEVYETYQPTEFMKYFKGITTLFYIFICWSGLYFGVKFYEGMQQAIQGALRANALAHQAQLKMLRYQLNPHFLFNTLNAISTLILEKNHQIANDMVSRLSDFLRYSLDNDPMQKVTLAQEIHALKLYLGIEKVRFEERLNLEFDIDEAAESAMIPSLLLQPLVENAIKYAIARSEHGGKIAIRARVFARELLLEVADDGPGVDDIDAMLSGRHHNGCGVGVRNTRERLRELYGDDHGFQIDNLKPSGLQISIRLPYQTEDNVARQA